MEDRERAEGRGLGPLEVMGLFWFVLGVVMVIAVYAPETATGKLVNLAAGLVFLAIGTVAFAAGRRKRLSGGGEER